MKIRPQPGRQRPAIPEHSAHQVQVAPRRAAAIRTVPRHCSPAPRGPGLFVVLAGMALFLIGSAAHAEYKGEFIPFPLVTLHFNDRDVAPLDQHGSTAAVDFFYSAEYGQARLLAEFFIDQEEREMERLAVGWVLTENTRLWLGRYHTALDQWNRKHHHGAYLQTTIYRPGIIEFEEEGGAIPAHATGISLQKTRHTASHMIYYTLDLGLGPELTPGHLSALDILKPGRGDHQLLVTLALSHHAMETPFDDSGVFVGYVVIPSSINGIDQARLNILGAYSNYSQERWHVRGSLMRIGTDLDLSSGNQTDDAFFYAYLQPEYRQQADLSFYGRVEISEGAANNLYLQQIPAYIRQRGLIGARYQLSENQALKFELANLDQYGQRYSQATLQWSAALP